MSKMSKSIAVTWLYSSLWFNDFMRQYLRLNDEKLHFKDVFLPPYDLFSLPVISSCKGILHLFYDGYNGGTRTCWFLKRNTIKVIRIVIFMYVWNQYAHMHIWEDRISFIWMNRVNNDMFCHCISNLKGRLVYWHLKNSIPASNTRLDTDENWQ